MCTPRHPPRRGRSLSISPCGKAVVPLESEPLVLLGWPSPGSASSGRPFAAPAMWRPQNLRMVKRTTSTGFPIRVGTIPWKYVAGSGYPGSSSPYQGVDTTINLSAKVRWSPVDSRSEKGI